MEHRILIIHRSLSSCALLLLFWFRLWRQLADHIVRVLVNKVSHSHADLWEAIVLPGQNALKNYSSGDLANIVSENIDFLQVL